LHDFLDHRLGSFLGHIVDDNIGAEFPKHQGVASAKSGSSTSNDNRLVLE
jgi:hypothetical protein